jgi:phytoene synthase
VDPHQYAERLAAAPGTSLYYAIRALAPEPRRAIAALYAFVHEVRRAARDVSDPGVARKKLLWWRDEAGRLCAGHPQHPAAQALAPAVAAHAIERERLDDVIEGAAMDIEYNAYPDFDALAVYCARVGGVPMQICARILGCSDPQTIAYARTLGIARELTRIIREVAADSRRGRIYLPLHELAEYGVTAEDVANARETANLKRLIGFQIGRARDHFDHAIALLPRVDRRAQRPTLALAAIDRALLAEIEADGCRVLTRRIALTPLRKLWIAWRAR